MANSVPVRTLKDSEGSGNYGLALKVFSGTVLEAFRAKTKFWDNTGNIMAVKQLDGGRTAQWPIIGDDIDLASTDSNGVDKGYHTPGHELLGQDIKMSEETITVDDVLVAQVDVPFADLDLNHFDVIQPYGVKLGRSLAIDLDKKCATIAMKAARAPAVSYIHSGGNEVVTNTLTTAATYEAWYTNDSPGSTKFRNDASSLARLMDEDNVPEEGRYLFIPPYMRQILRHETDVFNRDYNPETTAGNLNERLIGVMEGFNLILTNHVPQADVAGYAGDLAKYNGVFDGGSEAGYLPAAIALCGAQEGAAGIGMVQASGLRTVIQDDERRNTKFMKAQLMVGIDMLCPWSAGAIGIYT